MWAEHDHLRNEELMVTTEMLLRCFPEVVISMQRAWGKDFELQRHSLSGSAVVPILARIWNREYHEKPIDESIAQLSAYWHDIGKAGVEDLTTANRKLTDEEMKRIKDHALLGSNLIIAVSSELGNVVENLEKRHALVMVADVAKLHHENWDGTGYFGFKGEAIPILARMTRVWDYWDTGYNRCGRNEVEVLMEIIEGAGTLFDPQVAKMFVENYAIIRREVWEYTHLIPIYEQKSEQGYGGSRGTSCKPVFAEQRVSIGRE